MRFVLAGFTICLIALSPALAQDTLQVPSEPPEWGEVSPQTLEVDAYPSDSNAAAVVIADVGQGEFTPSGEFKVERHTRIKILGEEGYDSGTVTIPYYAKDRIQAVHDIEGQTYTLNDSTGEVEVHEIDDDDVFEEDLGGPHEQMKFTLPNLEPGAVIEYQYELDSESIQFIPSWSFQRGEPTLYSEYRVQVPTFLEYATLTTRSQDYDTVTTDRDRVGRFDEIEKRWVMTEVPALREEPYITTIEDYRARLWMQIKTILDPSGGVEERIMTSWPDLAESLLASDRFGKNLGDGGGGVFQSTAPVEEQVRRVTEGLGSDSAKAHALYDYVRTSIEWDGTLSRVRQKDFEEILTTQTGSSAEVNLLLVSMLQNAGLEAHPVLLSTREHGKMFPLYPFVNQFNSVIAAVTLPNRSQRLLLDATDPLCPPSLLPERNLNRKGWLVRADDPEWIPISPPTTTKRRLYVQGALQADGTLTGNLSVREAGFRALDARRALSDTDPTAFLRDEVLDNLTEVSVTSVEVQNRDDVRRPLKLTAQVEVPGYGRTAGNMMYLNPQLAPTYTENPLERKTRTFPVDFAHPRQDEYILSLQLPDGYTMVDAPSHGGIRLPNNEGQFMRLLRGNGGRLTVRSTMAVMKSRFAPEEYEGLRTFFTQVISALSTPVVLEKSAAPGAEEEK